MNLRPPHRLPLWMLNLAAAGALIAPDIGWTQSPLKPASAPAASRPVSPRKPDGKPAEPTIILTQAQVAETDVQRELRRLYEESGREMPDVPSNIQTQRPQPAAGRMATQPPMTPPPQMTPITPQQPASSGNPVSSFFRRLVPGGQSRQPAQPPQVAPAQQQQIPQPPAANTPQNYAPYAGQQPRRLPAGNPAAPVHPGTPANQVATQAALPLPPSPTTAPAVPAPAARVTAAPAQTAAPVARIVQTPAQQAPAPAAAPVVVARQPQPAITPPAAIPAEDDELNFEPPVLVLTPQTPTATAPAPTASLTDLLDREEEEAPQMLATSGPQEFPDPFPEMSEDEADDLDESDFESPFLGMRLDEEPFPTDEIASHADPLADVPELAVSPAEAAPSRAMPQEGPALVTSAAPPQLTIPTSEPAASESIVPQAPSVPQAQIVDSSSPDVYAERMQQIRERGGMKGLKGFCPVLLRDDRELRDSQPEFYSNHRGQKFHFASAEAKARFDQNPARYAPAAYGADVVVLIRDKDVAEGSLDHAAWYRGNLYLFATLETYGAFVADPVKYATPDGLE
jgi:YHS domain-containing protein